MPHSPVVKMYDIKAVEFGQQKQQQQQQQQQQYQEEQNSEPKCNNNNNNNKNWLTTTPTKATNFSADVCSTPTASTSTTSTTNYFLTNTRNYSTCNILTPNGKHHHHLPDKVNIDISTNTNTACHTNDGDFSSDTATTTNTPMTLLSLRRRRLIQRHACLISIVAAFMFGLVLGVLMPMFGLANVFGDSLSVASTGADTRLPIPLMSSREFVQLPHDDPSATATRPPSDFPTIYELKTEDGGQESAPAEVPYSVAFIKEHTNDLSAEEVFRNAFHLEQDQMAPEAMIVKKLDSHDGTIKEFRVQRTPEGRFRKGPERRIAKASGGSDTVGQATDSRSFVPMEQRIAENARNQRNRGIIKGDIYWGDLVEQSLPKGFSPAEAKEWTRYVANEGVVERLESGCGRMQNRLVVFADGTRACARYRQNTDQIQGELFSFYLGQLLGLSNLAPSAPAVIDLDSSTWSSAIADITQSQWKQQRPVVLTRWLPDLEPAGIPQPFQPLERHLNKYDVWNITLGAGTTQPHGHGQRKQQQQQQQQEATNKNSVAVQQKGLLKRLEPASRAMRDHQSLPPLTTQQTQTQTQTQPRPLNVSNVLNDVAATETQQQPMVMQRLIELAQWSDLIVFDYLIANLDRVVNNLYNFQWNADIMAAPAHNLARQINTQLLVFLDNESGLLHGYRLLKKYEAYHGLLLDNLCVFREPTIEALRALRSYGVGRKLREAFEQTTSNEVRDVLPSLPDKSIKILVDRIDRVLGQVQKCRDLLAER